MKEVFQLGTKQGREGEAIFISIPLIELKKTEIIKVGNN
jgi:7-cyano-7-deazaguanine synthase